MSLPNASSTPSACSTRCSIEEISQNTQITITMTTRILLALLSCPLLGASSQASEVVQVDVRSALTGRAVTILTNGKLVPWTKGVDGSGLADGFMTAEASVVNGDTN